MCLAGHAWTHLVRNTDDLALSLAVFCENLPDLDTAERTIGLIAREALAVTGIIPFEGGWPAPGADVTTVYPGRVGTYPG